MYIQGTWLLGSQRILSVWEVRMPYGMHGDFVFFFAIFCTRYDLRPAIWSEPVFNTCEEVNDDDKVHGCFITIYNLHCSYWIWLQGGFRLDSYIKMYEIGHDGIQCEFLPPFDLKVALDNFEIKFIRKMWRLWQRYSRQQNCLHVTAVFIMWLHSHICTYDVILISSL